jgi:hypothetical protein
LATGDLLSGGRLTVGIGIGGRAEEYEAVGADPTTQTMRGMAERVAVMKRVWSGEKIAGSLLPVGPAPAQVDAMAPTTGFAGSEDELAAVLREFEAVGTDEIQLIPTSSDLNQLRRVADLVRATHWTDV